MGEAQQVCQLLAQIEDLLHQRSVVETTGLRSLIGGTGAVGGIDFLAQRAVVGIGDDRVIAGKLETDQPAVQPLGLRRLGQLGEG